MWEKLKSPASESITKLKDQVCATLSSESYCKSKHLGHTFESPSYPNGFSCEDKQQCVNLGITKPCLNYKMCGVDFGSTTVGWQKDFRVCVADLVPFC